MITKPLLSDEAKLVEINEHLYKLDIDASLLRDVVNKYITQNLKNDLSIYHELIQDYFINPTIILLITDYLYDNYIELITDNVITITIPYPGTTKRLTISRSTIADKLGIVANVTDQL